MKVKANKTIGNYITEGKEYDVVEVRGNIYHIILDHGRMDTAHKEHFTIIQDTPQIEVGSEWVHGDMYLTVKYVGDNKVFIKWNGDGSEGIRDIEQFLTTFKQKPKTLTMYFYKSGDGYIAYSSEHQWDKLKFTREIEL